MHDKTDAHLLPGCPRGLPHVGHGGPAADLQRLRYLAEWLLGRMVQRRPSHVDRMESLVKRCRKLKYERYTGYLMRGLMPRGVLRKHVMPLSPQEFDVAYEALKSRGHVSEARVRLGRSTVVVFDPEDADALQAVRTLTGGRGT